MRVFVVSLIAVFGLVSGRSNDGFSSINRQDDGVGNYHYNYDITDWDTNHKRWETVDANNNRRGGYTITDVDGKVRQVEYTADKDGFRAVVKTNEPGTKAHVTGDRDAIYINDGVQNIIRDAQPALQQTGHVLKHKKLGHVHHEIVAAPLVPVVTSHQHEEHHHHHQQVVQPVQRAVVQVHQPVVQTIVQPAPVQQPIVETFVQRSPEPVVHIQQQVVPKRTVAYTPVIAQPQPVFEQVHRVHVEPIRVAPAPRKSCNVCGAPIAVRQEVLIPKQPVVDIPAYTGPRRRPQRPVEDPSQAFETPEEKIILTPKRVPAYAPEQDLPEEIIPTVPPPLSRSRVAYGPVVLRQEPVTRFAPIALRPVYQQQRYETPSYQTSYQPVPVAHSRCSRCAALRRSSSSS